MKNSSLSKTFSSFSPSFEVIPGEIQQGTLHYSVLEIFHVCEVTSGLPSRGQAWLAHTKFDVIGVKLGVLRESLEDPRRVLSGYTQTLLSVVVGVCECVLPDNPYYVMGSMTVLCEFDNPNNAEEILKTLDSRSSTVNGKRMKNHGYNGPPCVIMVIAKMSVMYSPVLKYSDVEIQLRKSQEMDSSIGNPQQHCHQPNSGLLRYCSAPSSLLASLVGNAIHEESFRSENHQHYLPSTSSEMDTMLSKLVSSNNVWSNSEGLQEEFRGKPVKQELGESVTQGPSQQNGYGYGESQLIYQSQQIQGLPNGSSNAFDGSFGAVNSIQSKFGVRNCSNLLRQKSSPAEFFSIENELAALREVGSFKANDVSNGQATASTSGLHGSFSFPSRPSSCLKRMPQIAEIGNESIDENCNQSRNLVNDSGSSKCYIPSFTGEFWDSPAFNAPKTESEDEIMFSTSNGLESQEADFSYQNIGLTHHLSLPSSSTKISSIEKFLQIQGSVPCKIRAKRGFATHPRSIAERVRRTRISERIKKLQGLFPKSEKQTSTADMLDLAVEYIKDLQRQVKVLTDCKAKCKCTSNEKHCTRTCA
ncbi:hypothetical protein Fmac_018425 [Flemingia macrophylla]|uniref:BHLH domain-containing protein n=1 Tax=Flemingia macrophylla TaxID=520843 RepID=A0ABD1M4Z1_9FABA